MLDCPYEKRHGFCVDKIREGFEWVSNDKPNIYRGYDGILVRIREGEVYKYERSEWLLTTDKRILESIYIHHTDGLYTFCGPLINGNKERLESECLLPLTGEPIDITFAYGLNEIRSYIDKRSIDGLIFIKNEEKIARIRGLDLGIVRR